MVRSRRVVDPLFIDTSTGITVKPEQGSVRADRRSKTDILITLTDARANSITDREVQIELFTTSEYTGLVIDTTANISGIAVIILKSDAPAKITINPGSAFFNNINFELRNLG